MPPWKKLPNDATSMRELVRDQPPQEDATQPNPDLRCCLAHVNGRGCVVPDGYGQWGNWDDPENMAKEDDMALEQHMYFRDRGPLPPHLGGPETWMGIPFNTKKNQWGCSHRSQLPAEYAFDDWWAEESLGLEHRLAKKHHIAWDLRGPPNGPVPPSYF